MKNIFFLMLVSCAIMATGCSFSSGSSPMVSTTSNDWQNKTDEQGKTLPPIFSQFSDIPIPEKSKMDLKTSLVFGNQNWWIGRLMISAPYPVGDLFDFYVSEMPKFNWEEITVVRSQTSVLTFKQGNRVATIQLDGSNSSSDISFTVSPANAGATSSFK